MQFWSGECQHAFSFEQFVTGFWQRYPNPYSEHVLTRDVIHREVVDGRLVTKCLITKRGKLPSYLERLTGGRRETLVIEESVLDPEARQLVTYTRNIEMQDILAVHERVVYTSHPEGPRRVLARKAVFAESQVSAFGGIIAAFSVSQYQKRFTTITKGLDYVLNSMYHPEMLVKKSEIQIGYSKSPCKRLSYFARLIQTIVFQLRKLFFHQHPIMPCRRKLNTGLKAKTL